MLWEVERGCCFIAQVLEEAVRCVRQRTIAAATSLQLCENRRGGNVKKVSCT